MCVQNMLPCSPVMHIQQRPGAVECFLSKSLNLSCRNTTRRDGLLTVELLHLQQNGSSLSVFMLDSCSEVQPTKVEVVIHEQPPAPTAS